MADSAPLTAKSHARLLWTGPGMPLEYGNVPARARNGLLRGGIVTVGDLTSVTARDLRDIRQFGPVDVAEVRRVLEAHGFCLKGEATAGITADSPVTAFAASVRREREARDWSRERLAKESGVTARTVANVEDRRCGPSLHVAALLAAGLGMTVGALLGEEAGRG